ncbi:MAG: DNA polymerase III subunit beta [Alphaproteobacteria bacterium]|nr:MAG: DNA polymerase III subunit beta [Alphaproteobacteria bacterium]
MKLTIERAALLRSLNHVQSVVERRNTIQILSNVLIEAADGRLSLTTTDMDLAMVESVEADIAESGAITTPAHTLYDIVRKLPDGAQIALEYDGAEQKLSLASGRSRFVLACLPREEFPVMAEDDMPHKFVLSAQDLKSLIDKTRFAISTEETRFYLNGIYMHVPEADPQALIAVATDGHRLARVRLPLPEGAADIPGVIIPRKTVNEIRKLLDELDEPVQISLSESKIRFEIPGSVLSSKLIDGTFPDYDRVIPKQNDKDLEIDAHLFAEAIDRVSTISNEKSRAVKLVVDTDRVTLSVTSPDNGSATEEVAAGYTSETIEIGFNARYVLDIMGQVKGDTVKVSFADASAPTLVQDNTDDTALYVLMPMRV